MAMDRSAKWTNPNLLFSWPDLAGGRTILVISPWCLNSSFTWSWVTFLGRFLMYSALTCGSESESSHYRVAGGGGGGRQRTPEEDNLGVGRRIVVLRVGPAHRRRIVLQLELGSRHLLPRVLGAGIVVVLDERETPVAAGVLWVLLRERIREKRSQSEEESSDLGLIESESSMATATVAALSLFI